LTTEELLQKADSDNWYCKPRTSQYKFTIRCTSFSQLAIVFKSVDDFKLGDCFRIVEWKSRTSFEVSISKNNETISLVKSFVDTLLKSDMSVVA
jgi:hypothetical protein